MKIEIEIKEKELEELVKNYLVQQIVSERGSVMREASYGLRSGVDYAVREYIYSEKEKIIERVVKRASTEVVRKGMKKFLEEIK
jgi:hypothetical protein